MKLALSRKNLWEHAPRPVRRAAGRVLGLVPPAYLIGGRFRAQMQFLQTAEWWDAGRARAFQLAELRRICTRAYEHTRYYRRLFDEAGVDARAMTFETLRSLPALTADDVRRHLDEMCTIPPSSSGVDYATTGGTGGNPLRFYIDAARSQTEFAYLAMGWRRVGFSVGTPRAIFRGREVRRNGAGLHHEHDRALREHSYSSFHLTDDEMGRALDHVAQIGPCFLHVYPSSAETLARFLQRSKRHAPRNVLGLLAESENVYPEQRELVERVFGRRLFSSYGMTEKVVAAAECEKSTNYHVWPTYGYFELLDERGAAVSTPGARGEIVGTGFINTVVPFIRYRTGDYATYVDDRCSSCGREHPVISGILGHRTQEMLVAADGTTVSWTALNMHDDTFDNIRQFQFFQNTPGQATLRIVRAPSFGDDDARRVKARLDGKLDGRIAVTLEFVEAIALSTRGKAIYVDQQIPIDRAFQTPAIEHA